MSAADHLRQAIAYGCTRDDHDHVGDHRAEVLLEAAAAIEQKQATAEAEERNRFAFLDHETVLQGETIREAATLLRKMAYPNGDPIAYGSSGIRCGCGKDAHSNLVPCQQDSREDTYKSPLHSDYAVPHDLPEFPAQRDRRHV